MGIQDHVAELERQGQALAAAAERAGPDAVVSMAHTGGVHEWA